MTKDEAEAKPTMTEDVREALMRLTMCAREECGMCKYKDECGFDFQYNISTDNMHTLLDALSAEAVQVVRCKDCRWYDNRYGDVCHNPRYGDGHANYQPPYVDEDYWCKDGERKGGDE